MKQEGACACGICPANLKFFVMFVQVQKCTPSSATGSRNEGSVKLSSELGTHKVLCDQKNSSVPSPPWPVKVLVFSVTIYSIMKAQL